MTADPTKGDAPILDPGPIVEIGGTPYTLRRLGVRDTFKIARIVAVGAASTKSDLTDAELADPNKLQALLLAGVMAAEVTVLDLCASLIGVTVKDLEDPERFPMSTPIDIAMALVEHQDVRAFFAHVKPLVAKFAKGQKTKTN